MCFSAGASFGAGTVLLAVGAMTLHKVRQPRQIVFASMPILFSIQQFTEGFVWLSLTNSDFEKLAPFSTCLFLFFAQVVWPVMAPLSIFLIEEDKKRKKILLFLTGMGALLAIYLTYCLFVYNVKAEIISFHIHYIVDFPLALSWVSTVLYFIPTVVPNFISGNRKISLLGITVVASYLFTKIFYPNYFISVWCFFAAILSLVVLYIVIKMNQPHALHPKVA